MPRRSRRRTLASFASPAGFTQASLAALTGVDASTISRNWHRTGWAETMIARNVLTIAASVPGLAEALVRGALQDRLDAARSDIAEAGLSLNEKAIDAAIEGGVVPEFLYTSMVAAGKLLLGDVQQAESVLRSCWGREQTRALDVAFGTHQKWHALEDSHPLIVASIAAYEELSKPSSLKYHQCIALNHLAHHIGKATGEIIPKPPAGRRGANTEWVAGFYVRGAYMGKLRHTGTTIEVADAYDAIVQEHDNAHAVERWAFPSWVGDLPPGESFEMPPETSLKRTAKEILDELATYNPVYVYYLAQTFIPLALEEIDATFGDKRDELVDALRERAKTIEDATISAQLLKTSNEAEGAE